MIRKQTDYRLPAHKLPVLYALLLTHSVSAYPCKSFSATDYRLPAHKLLVLYALLLTHSVSAYPGKSFSAYPCKVGVIW